MKSTSFFSLAMVLSVVAARASAVELQSTTVDAWQQYLRAADVRLQARLDSGKPFLWVDEAADRQLRVRRGEVVVAPLVRHGIQSVPNGLIHDWIGAVFIPNATVGSLRRGPCASSPSNSTTASRFSLSPVFPCEALLACRDCCRLNRRRGVS